MFLVKSLMRFKSCGDFWKAEDLFVCKSLLFLSTEMPAISRNQNKYSTSFADVNPGRAGRMWVGVLAMLNKSKTEFLCQGDHSILFKMLHVQPTLKHKNRILTLH